MSDVGFRAPGFGVGSSGVRFGVSTLIYYEALDKVGGFGIHASSCGFQVSATHGGGLRGRNSPLVRNKALYIVGSSGFGFPDVRFWYSGLTARRSRVWGFGFRMSGLGLRVSGLRVWFDRSSATRRLTWSHGDWYVTCGAIASLRAIDALVSWC